jgi:hypothetical protein
MVTFSSGVASADAYAGQTYGDAKQKISSLNQTPVIATVSGDKLATDDCIVVSSAKSVFLDGCGKGSDNKVMLNLNCNDALAAPGKPGNSLMTPEGRQAKNDEETAQKINQDASWCRNSDDNMAYCQKICKKTGDCEL